MKIKGESHLDHGLTPAQVAHIVDTYKDRTGFFIETLELPENLGTVPCGLYGPMAGDVRPFAPPSRIYYGVRPGRSGPSRLVILPARQTRKVTVIAGPAGPCGACTGTGSIEVQVPVPGPDNETMPEKQTCSACNGEGTETVLYTAHGGPAAPREPWDPSLVHDDLDESLAFWKEHALSAWLEG